MGHRLSKIYTRTGDDGTTGLANGERIDKTDARVEAFGNVDETNSALGLLLAEPDIPSALRTPLTRIQHELFEIGASCRCRPIGTSAPHT
jgi:cob(I)alamin adenosyltransferase